VKSLGFGILICALSLCQATDSAAKPLVPAIVGDWWTVASSPDLGEFTNAKQEPVDFGIWCASDGTWQLWSCIRGTKCGGMTRLFHRWEGKNLTDSDWTPLGIAMQSKPEYGETAGGLQAPFVMLSDGRYVMFYGDWEHICLATSSNGKQFSRQLASDGRTAMFTEGKGNNTRDPMVIRIGDTSYCYYTAYPNDHGAVYCRTSTDLRNWSESTKVAYGGSAGTNKWSSECPFVVRRSGVYYLFRTQHYGKGAQTSVYCSKNPLDFGVENDKYLVCRLPVAAPEIVHVQGQDYIACLLPSLQGIRVARLNWVSGP
jgi:hypothetical protein